jgi:hypothetical protein
MTLKTRRLLFYTLAALFIVIGTTAVFYSSGWRFDLETFQINRLGALFFEITPDDATITIDKANFKFEAGFLKSGTLIANLFPKTYTVTISKPGYQIWIKELTVLPSLVTEAPPVMLLPEKQNFTSPIAEQVKDFWVGPKHLAYLTESNRLVLNNNELIGREVVEWSESGDLLLTKSETNYFLTNLNRPYSALNINLVFNNLRETAGKIGKIRFAPREETKLLISALDGLYVLDTQKMKLETISRNTTPDFDAQGSELLFTDKSGVLVHSLAVGSQEPLLQNEAVGQIKKVSISPSGYAIALIDQNNSAYLFDRKSMRLKLLWAKISKAQFSPDSKKLLLISENKELIVYSLPDEKTAAKNITEEPARFQIGSIDESAISWHENSNYLFIKYPSSLYLLEANNLPPINFQIIDSENKKYQYSQKLNAAYLLKESSVYQIALE